MNWRWLEVWASPQWFYHKTTPWMPWLFASSLLALLVGSVWGLGFAPTDYKQGHSYRIIYIHVPASFVAMAGYMMMALAAGFGMIWRSKMAFMSMKAAAPIGATFTLLSLVSGAFWGKPTWGTWWEWDARITFMLVLLFLYLGVISIQHSFTDRDTSDRISAILSLVGVVNIPVIYKSVDWWFSLHQGATIKIVGKSSIHASMAYPFVWMVLAFYLMFTYLWLSKTRVEVLDRSKRLRWVAETIENKRGGLGGF